MITKCRICRGSGRVIGALFDFASTGTVCPACKGAGEFEIAIPSEKLATCKFCRGSGRVQSTVLLNLGGQEICPACKGVGVIERPTVGKGQTRVNKVSIPQNAALVTL
jgi:DnaJ-class molecular chaperone